MQVTIEWNWINHIVVILHTLAYLIWFRIYLDIVLHSCWIWLKMSPKTVANAMIKSFSFCTQMHNARTHTNLEIKTVTKLFKTKGIISQPNLIHSQRDENDSENVTPPQKTVYLEQRCITTNTKCVWPSDFYYCELSQCNFYSICRCFFFYFILSIDCIFFRRILAEYFTWIRKQ